MCIERTFNEKLGNIYHSHIFEKNVHRIIPLWKDTFEIFFSSLYNS